MNFYFYTLNIIFSVWSKETSQNFLRLFVAEHQPGLYEPTDTAHASVIDSFKTKITINYI